MTSVAIRIFLRYAAAFLVARGVLTDADGSMLSSDPELVALLEAGLGVALGGAVEAWTIVARRWGLAT